MFFGLKIETYEIVILQDNRMFIFHIAHPYDMI